MSSLLTGGANAERRKALLDMLSDEVFQRGLLRGAANIVPGIARGISADLLGGPVDMVTMALNVPAGLLGKKIEKPVGGSEWIGQKMEQAGLLSPQTGHPAETVSRLAGGLLASPQIVGRVGSAVENVTQGMAQNAMVPRTLHPQTGAIVYHGTPHKFAPEPDAPLGRFRSDKIGTGEGAQAYGHGLYFAGNPTTANTYAAKLSGSLSQPLPVMFSHDGASYTKDFGKYLKNGLEVSKEEYGNAYRAALDAFENQPKGNLYKVDLPDEAIAKMLDWDKPLSQQTPEVQKMLGSGVIFDSKMTGREVYEELAKESIRKFGEGADHSKYAADFFRKQLGVPGIRYLDQGSRGAGQGTYNYVVFPGEEGLLRILGRE